LGIGLSINFKNKKNKNFNFFSNLNPKNKFAIDLPTAQTQAQMLQKFKLKFNQSEAFSG